MRRLKNCYSMNILILTNHLNTGGVTRYVVYLGRSLAERGHKVFVASRGGECEKLLQEKGVLIQTLPLQTKFVFSPKVFRSYFILKRMILDNGIQVIHSNTRLTQFLGWLLSAKIRNLVHVSTFHGFYRPHFFRKKMPCFADMNIAISKAVAKHLVDDFDLNPAKLKVIYNGIEVGRANLVSGDEWENSRGNPTLGIISRLSAEKGHVYLFEAFLKLLTDYPQAKLLVVGDGREKKRLSAWVSSHNLEEKIIFLGTVPNLAPLFKAVDISVLPSLFEGLGFSILEAQENDVPVIASRVGGIVEIIDDKVTGILVEPKDSNGLYAAIKLVLGNTKLRNDIIKNAKAQIEEKFSLQKAVKEVELVYQKATETKATHGQ